MALRLAVLPALLEAFGTPPASPVTLAVDFASFLARADPVWRYNASTPEPSQWVDSLFGGNGDLGFQVWADSPTSLHMTMNRQTLWDDRTPDLGLPFYLDNFAFDQPRLPVGHFSITWTSGAPPQTVGRIQLHDARSVVTIMTPSGSCSVAAWASAAYERADGGADVIVLETSWTGSEACIVTFVPEEAVSTWSGQDARYVPNPAPLNTTSAPAPGLQLSLTSQPHLPRKGTWHTAAVLQQAGVNASTYFFTISPVLTSQAAADGWATTEVMSAQGLGAALRTAHEAWWHAWWPAGGFMTFEYSVLESFVFVQLYKFASGARAGRTVHDLEGPWFVAGTDWPDLHWDMNLQQTYYLPITLNRPDLSSTLVDYLAYLQGTGNLNTNVPAEWQIDSAAAPTGASSLSANETCYWDYGANCTTSPPSVTGNLLWVLSVVHMSAAYTGNATIDTAIVFPLLDRALQFYAHFQLTQPDGSIHLPNTFSPEYPGPPGPDANYDVALYRYSLALAIDLANEYGLISPHYDAWVSTLARITWFSVDEASDTFEIYAGVPYGTPHRHYSHLFMIWPLRLLDVTNASQYATARNSINLWLKTPEEDSMFYRPAASAMNVLLGQHAAAFDNVTYLLHNRIEGSTWYREGSQGSCTETPYAAAWAVSDWLLQSWNRTAAVPGATRPTRVIDFFPAVEDVIPLAGTPYDAAPAKVATASFYRLAVEGGVLASASRIVTVENATHYVTRTNFIAVESTVGGLVVVRTNMARPLAASPASVLFSELGDGGLVLVNISAGEGVALFSAALPPASFAISPAVGCAAEFNHWGVSPSSSAPGGGGTPVVLRDCVVDGSGKLAANQSFTWNATAGTFSLADGRCLSLSTCDGNNGDLVTLAPCTAGAPPPPGGASIGCDAAGPSTCPVQAQAWTITGPSGSPPNGIHAAIGGRCIDVNGAFNPDTIDVWDCQGSPGAYRNEEFTYVPASGAILSLDTDACCLNKCLTPAQ